ncbi:1-acyl-sn-glycerol-3-phosphate acyltransferase [Oxalobacteraceae bacterium GrIS 1.11]
MATCALLFPWLGVAARNRHIRRWSRQLMGICGVRVEQSVDSAAMLPQAMVVANHVSWLDIFVIDALHPCRFVAKSEIRAWPILGWLAAQAGTVFIARGKRRDLRHLFKGLVDKLAAGERIAFFPEGTTSAQGQLLPFHANLFEAAIDAKVPVQAIALSYVDAQGKSHASVDFLGDMTFAQSMVLILCGPPVTARLVCLPPITTTGAHRREVALAAQTAVAAALGIVAAAHA